MAELNGKITMKQELRPCVVNGQKALFHRWMDISKVIPPSPMKGGHPGGTISEVFGIVEKEDGSVCECYPYKIRFVDEKIEEYAFMEEKDQKGAGEK